MNTSNIKQGIYGGLAGGLVFGAMMGMMGMLPMVGKLVGEPSASTGFHHDGVSHVSRERERLLLRSNGALCTGHDGDSSPHHGLSRLNLVAHQVNRFWRWANKGDAVILTEPREFCVFRQESISRVNRVGSGFVG